MTSTSISETRPTVLQLLHSLEVGGAEKLALSLAERVSEHYRCVFACLDKEGSMAQAARDAGTTVHVLNRRSGLDWDLGKKLRRLQAQENIRLIHAHQYTPAFYAVLSGALRKRPPVLFTEHGRFHPDVRSVKRVAFNRSMFRTGDRVTAVGKNVAQALVDKEGFNRSRIEVIPNGIDLAPYKEPQADRAEARAQLRNGLAMPQDALIAIQVGRLDKIKDHQLALEVMSRLHDGESTGSQFHLIIVGEGPERRAIETRVSRLGLQKRVHLLGQRDDVPRLLHGSDVALLTSVSEGVPLALIEAMAAALPIVATAVGGVPEIVTDKEGLLAQSGDAAALTHHLRGLQSCPQLRQQLGTQGRATASTYSIASVAQHYLGIYDRLNGVRR